MSVAGLFVFELFSIAIFDGDVVDYQRIIQVQPGPVLDRNVSIDSVIGTIESHTDALGYLDTASRKHPHF